LFLFATAALAVVAFYVAARIFLAPFVRRPAVALRQKRLEEQIRWDRLHPPPAKG
jgi:hypothetical protein